jgi:hypothetical protein
MLRPRFAYLAAAVAVAGITAAGAHAGAKGGGEPLHEYLVELPAASAPRDSADSVVEVLGVNKAQVTHTYRHVFDGAAVLLSETDAETLRRAGSRVVAASRVTPTAGPHSQPAAPWHLAAVDATTGSSYVYPTNPGRGVPIYVVDTPVTVTHSEFAGRASHSAGGQYACSPDGGPYAYHGTAVASVAVGRVLGVAKDASVVSVAALDCFGVGSDADLLAALDLIFAMHPSGTPGVVNMSLGMLCRQSRCSHVDTAMARLRGRGLLAVAAAGNEGIPVCGPSYSVFPAASPTVLAVGATTVGSEPAKFSNFGSCVDIFAPGESVVAADNATTRRRRSENGTSFAAPLVAGAAAVIWGRDPTLTPDDVAAELLSQASNGIPTQRPGNPDRLLRVDAFRYLRGEQSGLPPHSAGSPQNCGFPDGPDIPGFARHASCWAKARSVTVAASFDARKGVSRAEMAVILWRAAGSPEAPDHRFADEGEIPPWAQRAADWLHSERVTTADPFRPSGRTSRAEVLTFLSRAGYKQEGVDYPPLSGAGLHDRQEVPLWAVDAAQWAHADRVTVADPLRSRDVVSRAEAFTLLWRASGSP